MNLEYTNSYINDFNSQSVSKYANKFKTRWEKNIKHREQLKKLQHI